MANRSPKASCHQKLAGILVSIACGLSTATTANAAGWTTNAVRILATQSNGGSFSVMLDSPANNVNSCATFTWGSFGVTGGIFTVYFPGGTLTDSQRAHISQLQAAQASGKLVGVYSSGCSGGGTSGYNTVDSVFVKTD